MTRRTLLFIILSNRIAKLDKGDEDKETRRTLLFIILSNRIAKLDKGDEGGEPYFL